MRIGKRELAQMIDHTVVKADTTSIDVKKCCEEAREHSFGAVCVNSMYISQASKFLKDVDVKLCSTIAFPFGASATEIKVYEAKSAIRDGADELDMVMNLGAFKSGNYEWVKSDIEAVVGTAKPIKGRLGKNVVVKVILETGYLDTQEIIKASNLVQDAGADFVKTCTGYGPRGASVKDIMLIRKSVGWDIGVKAAGGIRGFEEAMQFITAGATRLGASRSVNILKGWHL